MIPLLGMTFAESGAHKTNDPPRFTTKGAPVIPGGQFETGGTRIYVRPNGPPQIVIATKKNR